MHMRPAPFVLTGCDRMVGDLHCHTDFSDGSMSPEELVGYAVRTGLDALALTDHDTMEGTARAQAATRGRKIKIIPALEVSASDKGSGRKAHLLCYGPKKPDELLRLCERTLKSRNESSLKIIEKLSKKYPIDEKTVKGYLKNGGTVYKQHIMLSLMHMGFTSTMFGELYAETISSTRGWAYEGQEYPDVREALRLIKEAGGVAVLAHPGTYGNFDIVDQLKALGLDGIEAGHPRHREKETLIAIEAAREYGLLITGGSDFHGMYTQGANRLASRVTEGGELEELLARTA
jgi:predicted metal-dependent phosphoesterase TrpH